MGRGQNPTKGTLFVDLENNQYGFRDEKNVHRSGGSVTDNKVREWVDNDFHIFPGPDESEQ